MGDPRLGQRRPPNNFSEMRLKVVRAVEEKFKTDNESSRATEGPDLWGEGTKDSPVGGWKS